jgi:ATP-dependent DNA helicase RecQ
MKYKDDNNFSNKKSVKKNINVEQIINDFTNNDELYDALVKLRSKTARVKSVPAYVIFTDKTLREMCARRPLSEEAMLQISGVGESKLKTYGKSFMKVIREFSEK